MKLDPDKIAGLLLGTMVGDALAEAGTPDDLPLLRKIAQTDPLVRGVPAWVDRIEPGHPVRIAAERAIQSIEARQKKGN